MIHHGAEGGCLARAGGPAHQHQAPLFFGQTESYRWQAQLFRGARSVEDAAQHEGDLAALAVGMSAASGPGRRGVGGVGVARGSEACGQMVGNDDGDHLLDVGEAQDLGTGQDP